MQTVLFVLLGYLSGSVLYARVVSKLLGKDDITEKSRDRNPGAANAFLHGGFFCGILTLLGDLLKGFFPVHLCIRYGGIQVISTLLFAFVLAAPVFGHICSVFYGFQGGKGISVTFGCLLGLAPVWKPAIALAGSFLFFSLVLRITPHLQRTVFAYLSTLACIYVFCHIKGIYFGFMLIAFAVCLRLCHSKEPKEQMRIQFLWLDGGELKEVGDRKL